MKKLVVLMMIFAVSFAVTSCGKAKEATDKAVEETKNAVEKTGEVVENVTKETSEAVKEGAEVIKEGVEEVVETAGDVVSNDPKVVKGKELFTAKACTSCHTIDKKVVGPSIKEIAKVYAEKNGNLVQFLKGKKDAIVDTDPAQVAVMKANLTGVLKGLEAEEYQALAAYIRSVK